MPDVDSSATAGLEIRGYRRGAATTDGWDQYVVPVRDRITSYSGRAATFRITGRAATTQNLLTIYNNSATVLVEVNRILFDAYGTAARIITTAPGIVRVSRFTTAPTNGTTLSKVPLDTTMTSDSSVTLLQDASADGTNSATALGVTIPAGNVLTQEVMPRNVWISGTAPAAGVYTELADRMEFFVGNTDVTLRQGQGLVLHIAAPAAASNPATDFFVANIDWEEYTRP
jgi:hypothetical protein